MDRFEDLAKSSMAQLWLEYCGKKMEVEALQEINAELVEALIGVVRVADRATVEFDTAKAAIAKATGKQQPKDAPVWYFMRDNHTFRKLTGSVESMLAAINEEISAGYTSGSVFCRELKIDIHCNYKNTAAFTEECRAIIAKAIGEQHG